MCFASGYFKIMFLNQFIKYWILPHSPQLIPKVKKESTIHERALVEILTHHGHSASQLSISTLKGSRLCTHAGSPGGHRRNNPSKKKTVVSGFTVFCITLLQVLCCPFFSRTTSRHIFSTMFMPLISCV